MNKLSIPQHVAIIMDGNGRWSEKRGLPRSFGHKAGVKALKKTIKDVYVLGIKHLSVYVFSNENWKRPKEEVAFLMGILEKLIVKEVQELHKNEVKVRFLGEVSTLSQKLQEKIAWAEQLTAQNSKLQLNLLVNYGGRQDIIQAVNRIAKEKIIPLETIDEKILSQFLYTAGCPDPELIIRTGGEYRLSNFLLWQAAYSELWVTPAFWPDFNKELLLEALNWYSQVDRRFGGLNA